MAIIDAKGLSFSYGSTEIIKSGKFQINDGDKVGIIGPNGAGKTTLLRLISGQLHLDSGEIYVRRGTDIGYLEQVAPMTHTSAYSYCEEIFSDVFDIEERMRKLESIMAHAKEEPNHSYESNHNPSYSYESNHSYERSQSLNHSYESDHNPNYSYERNQNTNHSYESNHNLSHSYESNHNLSHSYESNHNLSHSYESNHSYEKNCPSPYDMKAVLKEYGELQDKFADIGGYEVRSQVTGVLTGLGIPADAVIAELSGGERSKLSMGRLLLRNPELLFLDEPTNHLDINSVSWMENFLEAYRGTLVVVSHDRYFLEKVCDKILLVEHGDVKLYRGGYRKVMEQIKLEKAAAEKAYELQQKEIKRQEGIIREFYNRATELQIKKAKSRQKMLDRLERLEKPTRGQERFNLRLKSSGRGGNEVLIMKGITKSFEGKTVLDGANLSVFRQDKIGLIGGNGTGKTTLFRIALGRIAQDSGSVKLGSDIKTGYFEQNAEGLRSQNTLIEEIHDAYPRLTISEVRGALGAFLFRDDLDRKVGDISGGERSRLALLKLMMSPANLLLLDEPTNHLDMYSKELLDGAIRDYDGTAVIISHDRFFLNEVCNKIALLEDGAITMYEGNYDDYLEARKLREPASAPAESTDARTDSSRTKGSGANESRTSTQASGFHNNFKVDSQVNDSHKSSRFSTQDSSLHKSSKSSVQDSGSHKNSKSSAQENGSNTGNANTKSVKASNDKAPKRKPLRGPDGKVLSKLEIERRILEIDEEIEALKLRLYDEDIYSDYKKIQEVEDKIDKLDSERDELYIHFFDR